MLSIRIPVCIRWVRLQDPALVVFAKRVCMPFRHSESGSNASQWSSSPFKFRPLFQEGKAHIRIFGNEGEWLKYVYEISNFPALQRDPAFAPAFRLAAELLLEPPILPVP